MRTSAAHLSESAQEALALPPAERIERIRSPRWIGYTRAKEILKALGELLAYPKTHRMPNLLLVADTNNGKTVIASRFRDQHPARDDASGQRVAVPVLLIQALPAPDEARFYTAILEKLFASYRSSDRVDRKQAQALDRLRELQTRMLMIDEIHHLLAGSLTRQRTLLNTIKYVGNELQIPIVGIGTKAAFNALQIDPQLSNRFVPEALPRWEADEEYLKLLASFERMLPLREPSGLVEPSLALKVLAMSEGTIGEISTVLTKAAVRAIETGTERIDPKILDSIGWVAPSDRKWTAGSGR